MDGDIRFNIGANTAQFDAKMARVADSANTTGAKLKQAFSGLGGILVGGSVVAGLNSLLSKMDNVSDAAKRLGASSEDIQRVGNAAQIVGTDMDAVARSMNKMGVQANKAARDGGDLADAFDRVNIDPAAFAASGLADRIRMVAKAQQEANGDATKMAELLEVVGVRAANINFAELVSEMNNVNVVADATVQALADANDQLDKMKQNATIFGANLLKALVIEPAERLGNIMAGGVGQTNAEIDAEQMRANAQARLRQRGELLPDDSTTKKVSKFVGGPVPATVEESVPGPNAEENVRRINAELEKMKAELEAAKAPTVAISDELDKQGSKAEKRNEQQRELKQLALEIREAEAAGNETLAANLREYEALIKASIEYEGDLEMAARDVNAAHKERLRLQEQALQKSIAQIEKEVELAETMAFGTDEAKKKAEWMKTYDSVLEKTGRDDLARRAANAETAEPERGASPSGGGSSSGGGGGTSAPRPGTALDALRKAAETDASARANLFRIEADKNRRTERVSELMDGRFFSSAANTQLRAERDAERRAQDFMNRRAATAGLFTWEIPDLDNIPTRNMGELEKRFRQHNPFSTREDFDRFVRDQQKTPEERLREEEKAAEGRSGSGTSAADPMAAIMSFLTATFGDFKDRVPQNALTT
jgi:hypothetical protein